MSFEHPTPSGVVQLTKAARSWAVRFADKQRGRWRSPDAAAHAVASHQTGIPEWDERRELVSEDIIDWRPVGRVTLALTRQTQSSALIAPPPPSRPRPRCAAN